MEAPLAWAVSISYAWRVSNDPREAEADVWKRVAFACRYGKGVSLTEALLLPGSAMTSLCSALASIVEEENPST